VGVAEEPLFVQAAPTIAVATMAITNRSVFDARIELGCMVASSRMASSIPPGRVVFTAS
jgi:hypothetical protein